jgi:hypothetical protein
MCRFADGLTEPIPWVGTGHNIETSLLQTARSSNFDEREKKNNTKENQSVRSELRQTGVTKKPADRDIFF